MYITPKVSPCPVEPLHRWRTSGQVLEGESKATVTPQRSAPLFTVMPHTTNRTHSPSHSPSSDDENTPPQSLDTSMEALSPNQGERESS
jgi:hypothetical protein